MNIRNIIYYSILFLVIGISFFLYSMRFYPQLNSDDALNVLMTFYYKLPNDFYCWGQDRGGTFIPLISQVFHKVFGISAVTSVSISNYIVLILGYIGFSSFFKNKYSKILFAILWFLPAFRFIYLLRYPIGVQYSLIGFAIYLIKNIDFFDKSLKTNYLLLTSAMLLFISAVWVSDLALFTIGAFMMTIYYFYIQAKNTFVFRKDVMLLGAAGLILGFLFIRHAKSYATSINTHYLSINSISEFFDGVTYLLDVLLNLLKFQTEETLFSIFYWLTIILIITVAVLLIKYGMKLKYSIKPYFYFFLIDIIFILGLVLFSEWVLKNGFGRRYFIGVYISSVILLLMLIENSSFPSKYVKRLKSLLVVIAILGASSTVHVLKFITPKSLRSEISVRSEFLTKGNVGIIAEYWNSYVSACPNPAIIKATPHDKSGVRNQVIVDEVLSQPNIYVIKDNWLERFPDTLEQFGYKLLKQGDSFQLANCEVNRYVKIKRNDIISFNSLKHRPSVLLTENEIVLAKDSVNLNNKCVLWGPYNKIGKGNFVLTYIVKLSHVENQSVALFDVVANYGKTVLAKKELHAEKFSLGEKVYFELEFSTDKRYNNIEFRTHYYGGSDLIIEGIRLVEK